MVSGSYSIFMLCRPLDLGIQEGQRVVGEEKHSFDPSPFNFRVPVTTEIASSHSHDHLVPLGDAAEPGDGENTESDSDSDEEPVNPDSVIGIGTSASDPKSLLDAINRWSAPQRVAFVTDRSDLNTAKTERKLVYVYVLTCHSCRF